jgi:Ser/Thr protein kinase RdoA (MazF antagonist)
MTPVSCRRWADVGQAVLVVVAVVVVLATVAAATARFGVRLVEREQAQIAADAAALAAVTGGRSAAAAVAAANGATIVEVADGPDTATVIVSLRGVRATARASRAP